MEGIGRRILDRRLQVGYSTQGEAAAAAGIGTTTWGLMEAKGTLPKTRRVRQQIARALQWPPQALDNLASGVDAEAAAPLPLSSPASGESLAEKVDALAEEIAQSHADLSTRLDRLTNQVERLLQDQQEAGQAR